MTIGIQVGSVVDEIGSPDFFHAFFSTISGNLEVEGWGSRFPIIVGQLYQGGLATHLTEAGVSELHEIQKALSAFSLDKLIWDVEDLSKQPPWGTIISDDITSLADYFVTTTGRDLLSVLLEALEDAASNHKPVSIVEY